VDEDSSGSGSEVNLFASFFRANIDIPVGLIKDNLIPTSDSCEVINAGTFPDDFEIPDFDGITASIETISAGETIVFSATGGTYATLMRETLFSFTFYTSENPVAGLIPTGLVVDIPGDVFPAFSNITVPNAGDLVVSSPAQGDFVTPDTTFTWVTSSDSDSYIEIAAISFDFMSGAVVNVNCEVIDDGSFTFPSATKDEMGSGFSSKFEEFDFAGTATLTRTATKIVEQNNAILFITSSSN
jgi:hypothetical protein